LVSQKTLTKTLFTEKNRCYWNKNGQKFCYTTYPNAVYIILLIHAFVSTSRFQDYCCSRRLPTIKEAIDNALDGDTVFVRRGTYREHALVINNTITLAGEGAHSSKITNIDVTQAWDRDLYPMFPPPAPIAIQINASNVKISGFTINGVDADYEPLRLQADGAQIEDNVIEDGSILRVWSNNNTIARNSIGNGFIEWRGSYNKFLHNKLTGNAHIDGAIQI
jgi:hypothetical protein